MQESLDQAREIRKGEEIEREGLLRYLQATLPHPPTELVIQQFPSGHSNLTYLLKTDRGEYILRRPPFGAKAIKAGHDMSREYRILSRLRPAYLKVPQTYVLCEDEGLLGAPFYIMERVQGVILRSRPPKGCQTTPAIMAGLSAAFVENLVDLHAVDLQASGLHDLGKPEGYIERQVRGWTERYERAKTDDLEALDAVARWLSTSRPPDSPPTLLHNDYKYDNLVLEPSDLTKIKAVLDWEMATIGDPWMDVGTALAYWVEPEDPEEIRQMPLGLTSLPGNWSRQALVDRYAERSGRDPSKILFFYVFGLFKVAVIGQQIYYRYQQGFTQDERFGGLIFLVDLLGKIAAAALDSGRLSPGVSRS